MTELPKPYRLPSIILKLMTEAYHDPNLRRSCSSQLVLLKESLAMMSDNQHYGWLNYTLYRLEQEAKEDPTKELPGMLYGMIYEAWGKLLNDYAGWLATQKPETFELVTDPEDAYRYLSVACKDMFLGLEIPLEIFRVSDLIQIISEIVVTENCQMHLSQFTPELVSEIIRQALDPSMKKSLRAYRAALKIRIENVIRTYVETNCQ